MVSTAKNRSDQLDAELLALEKKPDTPPEENKETSDKTTDWSKRYADLRSYADKQINDFKRQLAEKEKLIAEKNKPEMPATEEEFEAWLNKFPDVARIIETFIVKKSPGIPADLIEEVNSIKADRHALARDRAIDDLVKVHPDFFEIRDTEDFKTWFEEKRVSNSRIDNQIYSAVYEQDTDGREAAQAVTQYKNAKGLNKKPKEESPSAAFVPQGRGPQSTPNADVNQKYKFTLSQIEKMNIRDYERLESEIDTEEPCTTEWYPLEIPNVGLSK